MCIVLFVDLVDSRVGSESDDLVSQRLEGVIGLAAKLWHISYGI